MEAVVLLASKGLLLELKSALRLMRVAIWGEGSRTFDWYFFNCGFDHEDVCGCC